MLNYITSTYTKYTNKSEQVYKLTARGAYNIPLGIIRNKFYQFNEIRNDFLNTFTTNNINYSDNHHLLDSSPIENGKQKLIERNTSNSIYIEMSGKYFNSSNIFIEIFNNTKILLEQLSLNLTTLRAYQQKRILVKFNEDENDEIDKQIKDLAHSMTDKVLCVEGNIRKLNSYQKENLTDIERILNENMKLTLAQKLKEFTQEFKANEVNYSNSFKQFNSNNNNIDEEILDEDESNNNLCQINDGNEILLKRDREISKLLDSINDLASIFKDIQNLVQEQGTILDRIDYNIEEASDKTKEAHKHLIKANEHLKNNCFNKAILILMIVIFIECVLIMFKYV